MKHIKPYNLMEVHKLWNAFMLIMAFIAFILNTFLLFFYNTSNEVMIVVLSLFTSITCGYAIGKASIVVFLED